MPPLLKLSDEHEGAPAMPNDEKVKAEADVEPFVVPADLSPADAGEVRDQAVARIEAAERGSEPFEIDLDGDGPTPTALQILVAAKKSAEKRGVDLATTDRAEQILSDLDHENEG